MPGRIAPTMGPLEWTLLVTLSVLWGGTFFFAEVALEEIRPLTLVLARVSLAAAALILMVYASGHRSPCRARDWGAFCGSSAAAAARDRSSLRCPRSRT